MGFVTISGADARRGVEREPVRVRSSHRGSRDGGLGGYGVGLVRAGGPVRRT